MKKLFVLTAALAFSFAVMAQTRDTTATRPSERTCAEWRAAGRCPKPEDRRPCSEIKAAGECPKANAQARERRVSERTQTVTEKRSCPRQEGQACCKSRNQEGRTDATQGPRRGGPRGDR